MKIKQSAGETAFSICNTFFMTIIMILTIYPFLYVAFASISDPAEVIRSQGIMLWPKGINFEAYKRVMENPNIITGYTNTIFYVVVGTFLNLLVTTILAYGLSRKNVYWSRPIMLIILFTMFFSGGLIPRYMIIKNLHLIGTIWSILIPNLVNTFNLIILRTSFMGIPESMEESGRIDGANDLHILFKIIIPLSLPILAVMVLYYGVGNWNSWFDASLFLNKRSMYPLQLILREILIINAGDDMSTKVVAEDRVALEQTIKYATIMVATLPILMIYPFLQKYFVKGVMVGAIKG